LTIFAAIKNIICLFFIMPAQQHPQRPHYPYLLRLAKLNKFLAGPSNKFAGAQRGDGGTTDRPSISVGMSFALYQSEFTEADHKGQPATIVINPPIGEANPSPFGTLFT
jgi:hypothetical protein